MEFRHPDGLVVAVLLPGRSLLVMKGESRHLWSHGSVQFIHVFSLLSAVIVDVIVTSCDLILISISMISQGNTSFIPGGNFWREHDSANQMCTFFFCRMNLIELTELNSCVTGQMGYFD